MECMVKGGFGLKQTHQQQILFLEDFCSNFSNNNNNSIIPNFATSVAGEDFFVDQLLNLNNGEEDDNDKQQIDNNNNNNNTSVVVVVVKNDEQFEVEEQVDNQTPNFKKLSPFPSPSLDSVLSVPAEEADLEWLSQFVEDSFSQFSTPYPPGYAKPKPNSEILSDGPYLTSSSFNKSRRSKRARTGGRVWSAALSDPCSPSATAPDSSSSPEIGPNKKQKKKEAGNGPSIGGCSPPSPKRCCHCGVQKTPQWREGPMGSKTLCNACGVRYKSGRLLPEYRPACSPTFSNELHSNSHRKVLEMRKKKEILTRQPESGRLSHPVSSFG